MNSHDKSSNPDFAANLAFFLLERTGSIYGIWRSRMTAKEQRDLFGRFIGKGKIIINGEDETITNRVKVCFGLDYCDDRKLNFRDLN